MATDCTYAANYALTVHRANYELTTHKADYCFVDASQWKLTEGGVVKLREDGITTKEKE